MIDSRVLRLLPALLFIIFAANASGRPTMAEVVAKTEKAFSARCLEIGIRDSCAKRRTVNLCFEQMAAETVFVDPPPRSI
jgi:hypothetical protein